MGINGTALARVMLSCHAAEVEQFQRCPDRRSSARMERQIVHYQRGNRAICRLGCLVAKLGRRLREYGMPQTLPPARQASRHG